MSGTNPFAQAAEIIAALKAVGGKLRLEWKCAHCPSLHLGSRILVPVEHMCEYHRLRGLADDRDLWEQLEILTGIELVN
jgi:hypothetical protein